MTPARAITRRLLLAAAVVAGAALSGCAGLNNVSVDLATFGAWPAGRAPGTYAIDRLPSQQQAGPAYFPVEAAARLALQTAGFTPAAKPEEADVLVQVGARRARMLDAWAPDFGRFGGSAYGWRPGWAPGRPMWGPWGPMWPQDYSFEQTETAMLVVDRAKRNVLYEAHARYETRNGSPAGLLATMFTASLMDFPNLKSGERRVSLPLAATP